MSELTVPSDEVPLGILFDEDPRAVVRLDRFIPTDEEVMPYVLVDCTTSTDITVLLEEHDSIEAVELVDEVDGDRLLGVTWASDPDGLIGVLSTTAVTVLDVTGTEQGWHVRIRGAPGGSMSTFQQRCREDSIPIEVTRVRTSTVGLPGTEYHLTAKQQEALELAFQEGYFDSPRRTDLAELAEMLDVARSSLGSRLRRGTRQLVASTLVDAP